MAEAEYTKSPLWSHQKPKELDCELLASRNLAYPLDEYLPYVRQYTNLSPSQLQSLIQDARENHWTALDLSLCNLQELPDELWTLTDLKVLALGNRISRMPGRPNRITQLPRSIEGLSNLQYLSVDGLNIDTIPGEAPLNLPHLHFLSLTSSTFSHFPAALLIPSLYWIDLHFSGQLQSLPDQIFNLRNLTFLNLRYTAIESLPTALARLPQLSHLDIRGTPLAGKLSPEILKQYPHEIIRYVLKMQGNSLQEFFNEAKLILVGQPQVGKTSLMKRLVHGTYTDHPSTEGIDIETWLFSSNGEEYRLNVWDFGGQEIYHATHQFFLTRRSIYLLVWDALSEDEYGRIDYWLRTIQSFADDSPIFIVVNKCDRDNGRRKRLYVEDYQDRYPQVENKIYEVSCQDNIGIHDLRDNIRNCAKELKVMKTPWLTAWLNVRKKLEELSKSLNHIPYSKYLDICRAQKLEPEEALSLAKYLHDLGVILYYHDDLLLRNLVILSSEWGTDAVYKILDEQQRHLLNRNGILRPGRDLEKIWKDREQYPRKYYPHLLSLMKNFQLTFPIEDGNYLVAELLNSQTITLEDLTFPFNGTLRLRYDYDFMPAGIMTRFIVAANEHLEIRNGVRQCWTKGAYLRSGSAYALVRLFDAPPDRHIMIQVSGPDARSRQELLTFIRQKLDKVNSLFHKINITRKIPCICRPGCPFFFDYETLLLAERKGRPSLTCLNSIEDVDLRKLLDGVEFDMSRDLDKLSIHIENKPVFNNTNKNTNTTSVSVSLDIRNLINDLHECINDLRTETDDPELTQSCENISNALEGLDNCQTEEEVKRSGILKKLARFLRECADPESDTGKLLSGIKYAKDIVLDLGRKYNSLASLLGAPSIPLIGS